MIPSRRMFLLPVQPQQQDFCSVIPSYRQSPSGGILLTPQLRRRLLMKKYMLNRMPFSACPDESVSSCGSSSSCCCCCCLGCFSDCVAVVVMMLTVVVLAVVVLAAVVVIMVVAVLRLLRLLQLLWL